MIRIPITHDLPLKDYPRLRAHADWYLREAACHGPAAPGAKRHPRRAKARRIAATQVP